VKYNIKFSRASIMILEKISEPYYSAIKQSIIELADNPRPVGYKKLKGTNGYRIRVNNYRVIFGNVLSIKL